MTITNATALRKNLFGTIENVIAYNGPVTVTLKRGNISEPDYNAIMESLFLMSNPAFMEGYNEAKKQDRFSFERIASLEN